MGAGRIKSSLNIKKTVKNSVFEHKKLRQISLVKNQPQQPGLPFPGIHLGSLCKIPEIAYFFFFFSFFPRCLLPVGTNLKAQNSRKKSESYLDDQAKIVSHIWIESYLDKNPFTSSNTDLSCVGRFRRSHWLYFATKFLYFWTAAPIEDRVP